MNYKLGEVKTSDTPKRIVVVRALKGLGDLLCAVPAFRALRTAQPDAEIFLLGLPGVRPIVERFQCYINGLLEFPGYPGLPEIDFDPIIFPEFLKDCHNYHFDLAIQMHGSGIVTNPLTVMLGARYNAGFYLPGQFCPDTLRFLPYPEHEPEVYRHLRLMEFLGVPLCGDELEFPLSIQDFKEFQAIANTNELKPFKYICLHPGASTEERRWQLEKFAMVGAALYKRGFEIVITGTDTEVELCQQVGQAMQVPHYMLAGHTNLGSLAVLLKGARLLISNDTGVSHLATALRVPSVIIFSASDPNRWAPLNRKLHRIVATSADNAIANQDIIRSNIATCSPDSCITENHSFFSRNNVINVTVEEVLFQIEKLLGEVQTYAN